MLVWKYAELRCFITNVNPSGIVEKVVKLAAVNSMCDSSVSTASTNRFMTFRGEKKVETGSFKTRLSPVTSICLTFPTVLFQSNIINVFYLNKSAVIKHITACSVCISSKWTEIFIHISEHSFLSLSLSIPAQGAGWAVTDNACSAKEYFEWNKRFWSSKRLHELCAECFTYLTAGDLQQSSAG